jgi:hypothetical protein
MTFTANFGQSPFKGNVPTGFNVIRIDGLDKLTDGWPGPRLNEDAFAFPG